MKSNNKNGWLSISGPSHGTADVAVIASVIPGNMQDREVFWVNNLLSHLDEFRDAKLDVYANPDDSHGKHDVIIEIPGGRTIGVQVTELTYKLIRNLSSQRQRLVERIYESFQEKDVTCETKALIKFFIKLSDSGEPNSKKLLTCIEDIKYALLHLDGKVRILQFDFGRVFILPVAVESEFYVLSLGNIGIDLDFDLLPQSNKRYYAAVDELIRKKRNSISPWLLIWSLEFWIDKHMIGDNVIRYMKNQFATTQFEQVYFVESHDGDRVFQANFALHRIKG
jgi:hypothetical protein